MKQSELLDIRALETIMLKMNHTIESSQKQILGIAEKAQTQLFLMQVELEETKKQVESTQSQINLMTEEQAYLLQQRKDELEQKAAALQAFIHRSETLLSQVSLVLKYATGNLQDVRSVLGEYSEHSQFNWWVTLAQEEERKRIARDIHDETTQALTNVFLRLDFCEKIWPTDLPRVQSEIEELKKVVQKSVRDLRRIIYDLRPQNLNERDLHQALEQYTRVYSERCQIPVHLTLVPSNVRLKSYLETATFRIIQESLTNIRKHAQAKNIYLKFEIAQNYISAIIHDDGQGFDITDSGKENEASDSHFGLQHMQERVDLLGGELNIQSAKNHGTKISLHIPYRDTDIVR